jgi:hypothetical protein
LERLDGLGLCKIFKKPKFEREIYYIDSIKKCTHSKEGMIKRGKIKC